MKYFSDMRLRLLIGCFVAGMLLAATIGASFAAGKIRISVSPDSLVDGDSVYLGKIADIAADDPQLVDRLRRIFLGRSPQPGNVREYGAAELTRRLRQNGFDPADLVLQIPSRVVVKRSLITIGREKMKTLVSDYLTKNVLKDLPDARIKEIQVAADIELPGGRITYSVVPSRNAASIGKIPFSINFDVNGKFFKRAAATATVEAFSDVVVTRKPLGRYKPITENDIEVRRMDLAHLPSDVITDPEAVLGKRTKRAIGAQTALRSKLVEFPPLVKRGDVVVIVAESAGLKVTTLGQVKKKGRVGERIPVVNFDTKKILYARVLDSNTVAVDF